MKLYAYLRRMPILWLLFVLALAGATVLAACGTSAANPSSSSGSGYGGTTSQPAKSSPAAKATTQTATIQIVERHEQYYFEPATITIPKGATVVWTNATDVAHTVTSDTNTFKGSDAFQKQQTFQMVFSTAGTFQYHCSIHTYMKGTIVVSS